MRKMPEEKKIRMRSRETWTDAEERREPLIYKKKMRRIDDKEEKENDAREGGEKIKKMDARDSTGREDQPNWSSIAWLTNAFFSPSSVPYMCSNSCRTPFLVIVLRSARAKTA